MADNTICMYVRIDPDKVTDADVQKRIEGIGELCLGSLNSAPMIVKFDQVNKLLIFTAQNKSHATVRVYDHGLITIDIHHYLEENSDQRYTLSGFGIKAFYALGNQKLQISEEYIRALECEIRKSFGTASSDSNSLYAPIRRGMKVWPYAVTADERLQELDYDKLVFEKLSKWQNIRIFHSKEHGNVLFLDGDAMLGESDLIYTQTLCCLPQDSYKGKTVLILGGGDGGILHELLKDKPRHVLMAEIDDEVVKACRTHMRSVCGDVMDKYKGDNYEIKIEDCIKVLHESIQGGVTYDVVINDLTEFPVDKAVKGYGYDLETTSLITELSLKAVKPGGKLLARGNCLSADDYRTAFEGDLDKLKVTFKRKDVWVPSFWETYCLYEIFKPAESNGV